MVAPQSTGWWRRTRPTPGCVLLQLARHGCPRPRPGQRLGCREAAKRLEEGMTRAAFVAAAKAKLLSAEASAAVDDNKVKLYLQGGDEVDVRRLLVCLSSAQVDVSKVRSHGTIELTAEGQMKRESYQVGAAALWGLLSEAAKKNPLPGGGSGLVLLPVPPSGARSTSLHDQVGSTLAGGASGTDAPTHRCQH